jgi:outer membrane protein
MGVDSISCLSIAAMVLGLLLPASGSAQTLDQALAQAYRDNEALNSERASLRVTDEEIDKPDLRLLKGFA